MTPPNHQQTWQPHEYGDVAEHIGAELLTTTARRLGRSPRAVYSRMRAKNPINIQQQARKQAGMSTVDVARALGVAHQRVSTWATLGWLKQKRGYGVNTSYPTYDAYDVSQFLLERGGVIPQIKPTDLAWKEEVDMARVAILARCIVKHRLESLLCISHTVILYHRRLHAFPAPAFIVGSGHQQWYDRAAVRAWLDAHPQFWTTNAREGL